MIRARLPLLIPVILALAASGASADIVFLELSASGSEIAGRSATASIGGVDVSRQIEVLSFDESRAGTRYGPVAFTKRIDPSSTRLWRAFVNNEALEATFRFFRPNPETGAMMVYYTVSLSGGRLASLATRMPAGTAESAAAPTEEVSISFTGIRRLYTGRETSEFEDGNAHQSRTQPKPTQGSAPRPTPKRRTLRKLP